MAAFLAGIALALALPAAAAPAIETSGPGLTLSPRELSEDQQRAAELQGLAAVGRAYAVEKDGAEPAFKTPQTLRFNFADPRSAVDPATLAIYRFDGALWSRDAVAAQSRRREDATLSLEGSYRRGGLFAVFAQRPLPEGAAPVAVDVGVRTLEAVWYRDPRRAWYTYEKGKERFRRRVHAAGDLARLTRTDDEERERSEGIRVWLERAGREVLLVQSYDTQLGVGEVRCPVRFLEGDWDRYQRGEKVVFELAPAGRLAVARDLRDNAELAAGGRGLFLDEDLTFNVVGSRLEKARFVSPGRWTAKGSDLSMAGSAFEIRIVFFVK